MTAKSGVSAMVCESLPLDCAGGHAARDLVLQQGEHEQDGRATDDDAGKQVGPLRGVFGALGHEEQP